MPANTLPVQYSVVLWCVFHVFAPSRPGLTDLGDDKGSRFAGLNRANNAQLQIVDAACPGSVGRGRRIIRQSSPAALSRRANLTWPCDVAEFPVARASPAHAGARSRPR